MRWNNITVYRTVEGIPCCSEPEKHGIGTQLLEAAVRFSNYILRALYVSVCPMSGTEAVRFRFLLGLFLRRSGSSARFLPGPSKEPGLRVLGEKDRIKVSVIEDDIVFYIFGELCEISASNLGFKRTETQQRRGGVSEFGRSAVDFFAVDSTRWVYICSFNTANQSVLHTSCLFYDSLVTTNFILGAGSVQTEWLLP